MKRRRPRDPVPVLLPILIICAVSAAVLIPWMRAHAAGKLALEPMEYDCGVVDEGSPAVMQVKVQNVGDSPVWIKNVQTN
jgi:hypothetical protein